tara:strand:- start:230 stop:502 length:273 start_codon:yes stop_codon:yes gene_type:complete
MEWKDLTRLQRVHSNLNKRTWDTFPLSAKETLVKRYNKELQTAKDVGSLEVIKETPEQRAVRKAKPKASGGSIKNYSYGGRVANYSKEKV